jgi:hypothetical protein
MKTDRTPAHIEQLQDDDRSWFYIISAEPGYYKFGITTTLRTRMKSHYRDFAFTRIDAMIDCGCDAIMRAVETEFKKAAAERQLLVRRYDKTEVIAVPDITPFAEWVRRRVAEMQKQPQPPNNRGGAKKEKKYKAEIALLHSLREYDRAEIAVLREKVRALESLLELSSGGEK